MTRGTGCQRPSAPMKKRYVSVLLCPLGYFLGPVMTPEILKSLQSRMAYSADLRNHELTQRRLRWKKLSPENKWEKLRMNVQKMITQRRKSMQKDVVKRCKSAGTLRQLFALLVDVSIVIILERPVARLADDEHRGNECHAGSSFNALIQRHWQIANFLSDLFYFISCFV